MCITTEQAKSLAVAYHAFAEANPANQPRTTLVWGRILLEEQRNTGVEMYSQTMIEACMAVAERELAQQQLAA